MRLFYIRRCIALLFIIMPTLSFCLQPPRHALVIGNDTYPGNGLLNAKNDARAIAKEFAALGYLTTLALDLDRQAMTTSIDSYAASLKKGDTAVVYYAGHGLQVEGQNYLVPTDFRASQASQVEYGGYPLHTLLGVLSTHGATTEIVILDACRDNPFRGSRSLTAGWAPAATSAGIYLAFGTAPGSTAADNPSEGHGLFTQSLLHFLADPSDIDETFRNVRVDVISRSGGGQVPWISSSLAGSFHLNPVGDNNVPLLADTLMGPAENQALLGSPSRIRSITQSDAQRPADQQIDEASALSQSIGEVRGLHFEKALEILEAVLSVDPRCALALRLIGVVYQLTGRTQEAAQAFNGAIQSDPKDPRSYSYNCLSEAYDDSFSSEATCRRAILMKDSLPEAHLGLALSLVSKGRDLEAYSEVTMAVALDPASTASIALQKELLSLRRTGALQISER